MWGSDVATLRPRAIINIVTSRISSWPHIPASLVIFPGLFCPLQCPIRRCSFPGLPVFFLGFNCGVFLRFHEIFGGPAPISIPEFLDCPGSRGIIGWCFSPQSPDFRIALAAGVNRHHRTFEIPINAVRHICAPSPSFLLLDVCRSRHEVVSATAMDQDITILGVYSSFHENRPAIR